MKDSQSPGVYEIAKQVKKDNHEDTQPYIYTE